MSLPNIYKFSFIEDNTNTTNQEENKKVLAGVLAILFGGF